MSEVIRLQFTALPPSVNNLFRNAGKKRVPTKEYTAWKQAAGWELVSQRPAKIEGAYSFRLLVRGHPGGRSDLSNRIKAIEDLLVSHGVVTDDRWCASLVVDWSKSVAGCEVEIRPYAQEAA